MPPHNPLARRSAHPEQRRLIKAWVCEAYGLMEEVVVSVSELACRRDSCSDIETVIAIMRPGLPIETVRVDKPIADVLREDIAVPAEKCSG